jgi:hypothetical protein
MLAQRVQSMRHNMKRLYFSFAVVLLVASYVSYYRFYDEMYWPGSAHGRIQSAARAIQENGKTVGGCYSSRNTLNIAEKAPEALKACLLLIEPIGEFIEEHPREYIKRFYRAHQGGRVCEITLSTTWNENRIVGSDCYYGLFEGSSYEGIGMTDDPYG